MGNLPLSTFFPSTGNHRYLVAKVIWADPALKSIWASDNYWDPEFPMKWGFHQLRIGISELAYLKSPVGLERQETTEMTPGLGILLWFVIPWDRRICPIPTRTMALISSDHQPQVIGGWWENHPLGKIPSYDTLISKCRREVRLCMQLGKAFRFLHFQIVSRVSFVEGNPPSGNDSRFGHPNIQILWRWWRLCKPSGNDFRFSKHEIVISSRDVLSNLSANDSSFEQSLT